MQSSLLKQFIYGTFFLIIIFVIGYLVYLGSLPAPTCFDGRQNQGEEEIDCGGPCELCETKRLKPVQASRVSIFDAGNNTLTAVSELANPNVSFGADKFSYKLNFYDSAGKIIRSVSKNSFIYPGELKQIVEPGLAVDPKKVLRGEIELANFSWKRAQEFSLPKLETRDIKIESQDDKIVITGLLVNQNPFMLPRAVIAVILSNPLGIKVGASKTLLLDVKSFEERSFAITIPNVRLASLTRDLVKIFVETRK